MSQSRAKYGVFASLGNHDNWYNGDAVADAFECPPEIALLQLQKA
jgi:hypothetical protein